MADDSPTDATKRPTAVSSFIHGAWLHGLLTAGFVLGLMYKILRDSHPERTEGVLPMIIGVVLACCVVGGTRAMLLDRHTRWLPRFAIGGSFGAVLGALLGTGFVSLMKPGGDSLDLWLILGFTGACGLFLGLRTLTHRH